MTGRARSMGLFAAALAAACIGAGIAYAAIPDGNTIKGCYGKAGGVLRVIDPAKNQKCVAALEVPLSWNQTGPQGAKGDQGPAGAPGAKGEKGDKGDSGVSGLGRAFTNYGGGSLVEIGEGLTQTVASVTLPAGAYTLMGTTYVVSDADDTRFGQCYFTPGPPYVNGTAALAHVADSTPARLLVLGDVTITSTSLPVFLRCTGLDGAIKADGAIIATEVSSITPSE